MWSFSTCSVLFWFYHFCQLGCCFLILKHHKTILKEFWINSVKDISQERRDNYLDECYQWLITFLIKCMLHADASVRSKILKCTPLSSYKMLYCLKLKLTCNYIFMKRRNFLRVSGIFPFVAQSLAAAPFANNNINASNDYYPEKIFL